MPSAFDPDAAAAPDSGIFGLPHRADEAAVVLVPVPFDATTSYRAGAADGPAAIRRASGQVDLYDTQNGRAYEHGIHMHADDEGGLRQLSREVRRLAEPVLAGAASDPSAIRAVDAAGERVNEWVRERVSGMLAAGVIPGVVGGDHSVPFGGIAAAAERHPGLGVLQVDAHADLRRSYQGFRWSHASIMDNVLREVVGVATLVQVGIRDVCEQEVRAIEASGGRVVTHFDTDWQRRLACGEPFAGLCEETATALPDKVWVSFDIDGLDPALCPNTGTPVPGGLTFSQACLLLEAVQQSGREIVGFDLCEVAPGPDEWDAAVGARVLYKLCGFALRSRG